MNQINIVALCFASTAIWETESAITAVSVNGIAATSEDDFATWEATVSLTEGVNALAVSTTDSAGNIDVNAALVTVLRGGGASHIL